IELTPKLPACPDCGSLARPHIVWFGESYFPGMLEDCNEFTKFADLIFIIGTSGMISAPMNIALAAIRRGAYSIEINPERSTITPNVSLYIQESAGKALTEIWKHLN
ncbi:MAG TPA: Sir2 family NAD-dependent protein deacetylase, partial [Leptospiraceae bacterium]|nr:Sir2 family NAD-dependent protein deacetylase [Leptospiraceae bacterium]